jgi:hypothetical protein
VTYESDLEAMDAALQAAASLYYEILRLADGAKLCVDQAEVRTERHVPPMVRTIRDGVEFTTHPPTSKRRVLVIPLGDA